MSQIYKLTIGKVGEHEVFYVTGEGVFAAHKSGKLEKIFDPMMYSWNIHGRGNVYLDNVTGSALAEIGEK